MTAQCPKAVERVDSGKIVQTFLNTGAFGTRQFAYTAGRGHLEASNSNGSAGSADTSETAPRLRSLEPADGFSEPTNCLTAAAVQERAAAMFVVGTSAPQASGMSPAAKRATMELVMLAYNAANELCNTQGDALSQSFGNFDRVVGLGWLVGDAVDHPPLDGKAAYTFGIKLRKLPGELKADILEVDVLEVKTLVVVLLEVEDLEVEILVVQVLEVQIFEVEFMQVEILEVPVLEAQILEVQVL